jgi:hypothetical protein
MRELYVYQKADGSWFGGKPNPKSLDPSSQVCAGPYATLAEAEAEAQALGVSFRVIQPQPPREKHHWEELHEKFGHGWD